VLGWPKNASWPMAFLLEYRCKRLKLAQFLGQLGVSLKGPSNPRRVRQIDQSAVCGRAIGHMGTRQVGSDGACSPAHGLALGPPEARVVQWTGRSRGLHDRSVLRKCAVTRLPDRVNLCVSNTPSSICQGRSPGTPMPEVSPAGAVHRATDSSPHGSKTNPGH
jgi:hypothetical protein